MTHRSKGFLTPSLYVALGVTLLVSALGIALRVQTSRLDALREEYATFKAQVKAVGDAQEARSRQIEAEGRTNKEKADAENAAALAALTGTLKRLRGERASRGILPAAAPGSGDPDRASFKRAELERALQQLDSGISGLLEEGSRATVNLDTAKRWAAARDPL